MADSMQGFEEEHIVWDWLCTFAMGGHYSFLPDDKRVNLSITCHTESRVTIEDGSIGAVFKSRHFFCSLCSTSLYCKGDECSC